MGFRFFCKRISLNPNQIIALVFVGIIFTGTIILSLPISQKTFVCWDPFTALFTSTSAVCVTGLSLVDIWTTYNFFGQLVMLFMMEIGGLGFMSIVAILFHLTNKRDNIQSLSLMAQSIGADELKSITRIQKRLLSGSIMFEGIGAVILFISFLPYYDVPTALWFGIFHSVSAFCNAGFDLMGIKSPSSSLTVLQDNPCALITMAVLVVIGGIGFVVWDDIVSAKHFRDWSVYTRLVLTATCVLLALGMVLFLIFEFDNPNSMGNMTLGSKILNSFFQSVTTRTAGFAAIDQSYFSDKSIALTMLLMLIGGPAGSTAGGVKTVTIVILLKTIISSAFGKKNVTLFHRSITEEQIKQAFTIVCSFVSLGILGGFLLSIFSKVTFVEGYFESVSALATVGVSLGITSSLSIISKIIIIIFMFIGRVGLLTLTIGFFKSKENLAIKYPSAKILIG